MSKRESVIGVELDGLGLAQTDAETLRSMIEARLESQERELAEAVERSLAVVPRLLRSPIRKVLGL